MNIFKRIGKGLFVILMSILMLLALLYEHLSNIKLNPKKEN